MAFTVACTTKNVIRKKPVKAIKYFLVSDEPNSPVDAMPIYCERRMHRSVVGKSKWWTIGDEMKEIRFYTVSWESRKLESNFQP